MQSRVSLQRQTFEIEIDQDGNKTLSVEEVISHFVSHFQDLTKVSLSQLPSSFILHQAHLKGISWVDDGQDLEAAFV